MKTSIFIVLEQSTFIHSGYFYSASSSALLHRGASDTARILCRSVTPKRHRQLRVKDLPKVPTWLLERDSNPRPSGRKATNLPMSHHAPPSLCVAFGAFMKLLSPVVAYLSTTVKRFVSIIKVVGILYSWVFHVHVGGCGLKRSQLLCVIILTFKK